MPSLFEITIPVFVSHFKTVSALLDKAVAHAGGSAAAEQELLDACLIDDMLKLPLQVQRMVTTATKVAVQVGGLESVALGDLPHATFEDLQSMIQKTIAFISTATEESFAGKDLVPIVLTTGRGDIPYKNATDYVLQWAIPNFFFHFTTAYDLLRFKGVQVGKADFLGFTRKQ